MFRSAEDVTLVLRLILRLCAGHNRLSHQPLSQVQNWSTATLSPSVSGWQQDKTRQHPLQAHPLSDNLACQTGSMTTQYLLQAHPLSDNLACQTGNMTTQLLLQAHPLSDNLACQTGNMTTQLLLQAHPLFHNLKTQVWLLEAHSGSQKAFRQPGWPGVHRSLCEERKSLHYSEHQGKEVCSGKPIHVLPRLRKGWAGWCYRVAWCSSERLSEQHVTSSSSRVAWFFFSMSSLVFFSSSSNCEIRCCSRALTACRDVISSRSISCSLWQKMLHNLGRY